uniref:AMP-binding protein n=1 Tax=Paraconexibacter sp. TaxID=2949640 RepID=UPI003561909F
MESSTTDRRAVDARSIAEAFRITAEQRADEVAIRTKGDELSWTWADLRARADALSAGLAGLGLQKGDTVALLFINRPEFHLCDIAAMQIGGVPFSIYMQYTAEQIEFVVSDADARILFTEQAFLPQVLEARKKLPHLEHVIVIDGEAPEGCLSLSDVEKADSDFDVAGAAAGIEGDDLLTLIYTSGTTGPPKGVQLCHRNLLSAVENIEALVQFPEGARVISWLPSAHIAERAAHHYLPIVFGF